MEATRVCRICNKEYPIDDFFVNYRSRGGRDTRCRFCKAMMQRKCRLESSKIPKTQKPFKYMPECGYRCVFYRECKRIVFVTHHIEPYCFVESKYHKLYLSEYGQMRME